MNSHIASVQGYILTSLLSTLKVHAGNLDKKSEKNKCFKNIYIFGFSRPC